MAATLSELREAVQDLIGRSDKDSEITRYLNWFQKQLVRYHSWNCLKRQDTGTMTSGTESYALPTEHHKTNRIRITGSSALTLKGVSPLTADRESPDPSEDGQGLPSQYYIFGDNFYPIPIPDDNYPYSIRYIKWPTELSSDTDETDFDRMDDLLSYGAAMHLSFSLGMVRLYNTFKTAIFSHYPLGSPRKRGLMEQAIRDDKKMPDETWIWGTGTQHSNWGQNVEDPFTGL